MSHRSLSPLNHYLINRQRKSAKKYAQQPVVNLRENYILKKDDNYVKLENNFREISKSPDWNRFISTKDNIKIQPHPNHKIQPHMNGVVHSHHEKQKEYETKENRIKTELREDKRTHYVSKQKKKDAVQNESHCTYSSKKIDALSERKQIQQKMEVKAQQTHSTYYVQTVLQGYLNEQSQIYKHLESSMDDVSDIPSIIFKKSQINAVNLKYRAGFQDKITLIFDIDETIIHNEMSQIINFEQQPKYDKRLNFDILEGHQISTYLYVRPFAKEILKQLSREFEVITFTASRQSYADAVLDFLDPDHTIIHHRLYRHHCRKSTEGLYIKDLSVINRDWSKVLIIDNAVYSFSHQLANGVPILPFLFDKSDTQLKELEKYLMTFKGEKDVRIKNKQHFKLHRYSEFQTVKQLVNQLYCA